MDGITGWFIPDEAPLKAIGTLLNAAFSDYYPNFKKWWDDKVMPGITNGERMVFCAYRDTKIVGFMVLKRTVEENKICSFYVLPEYRQSGVGTFMMRVATEILSDKLIITVPEPLTYAYESLLVRYGFNKTAEVPDLYVHGITEIVYKKT